MLNQFNTFLLEQGLDGPVPNYEQIVFGKVEGILIDLEVTSILLDPAEHVRVQVGLRYCNKQ